MFKKLISTMLMFSILLVSAPVRAYDLGSAFNSITSSGTATVNDPGIYKSVNRNVITGGGLDIRIPQSRVELFSITPPSVRFSCGSISAHFGGFSFISGEQIEKMIQNISQAALGFILVLAIKTLCPQCESVLQVMKTLAQRAASYAADSCKVGLDIANKIGPMVGIGSFDKEGNHVPSNAAELKEEKTRSICGANVMSRNEAGDFLQAMEDLCSSVGLSAKKNKEVAAEQEANSTGLEKKSQRLVRASQGTENATWIILNEYAKPKTNSPAIKRAESLLIMSMLGTTAWTEASPYNGLNQRDFPSQAIPAALTPREVVYIYLCGAAGIPSDVSIQVRRMCLEYSEDSVGASPAGPAQPVTKTLASKNMFDCVDGEYQLCRTVKLVPVSSVLQGNGVAIRVDQTLRKAVAMVRLDRPLMGPNADPDAAEVLALLASAPFPIYQVINLAAVYPAQADELLRNMGVFYSQLLVKSILTNALNVIDEASGNPAPGEATSIILAARQSLNNMKVVTKDMETELVESWKAQQFMTDTIRQLNLSLQKEVLSPSMITGNSTAINLSNTLVNAPPGAPSAPTTPPNPTSPTTP